MNKLNKLQLFPGGYTDLNGSSSSTSAINVNVTNQRTSDGAGGYINDLTYGMKTYYDTELLENARAQHYFSQFGKKQPLPKGNGKTVEWRKWDTFGRANTLTEGVTPSGEKFGQKNLTATISQHGAYATFSDVLELTYVDDVILGATEEFGAAMADSQDLEVRDALLLGTNVMFPPKANGTKVVQRVSTVTEGVITAQGLESDCFLTSKFVNQVATVLKKNKAPKINGDYIAIIHPSVAMDLRNSSDWLDAHKYAQPEEIYNGEIGKLHGVRFIETTNVKVWGAGTSTGDSGISNLAVYGCFFFGKDAWGEIDPAGAGAEMIVKAKGSAGTADPLNQRSTVGYKFSGAAKILYPERLIRVECVSSFGSDDATN
jgi:N4-gp56 family major capsid protein